MAKTNAYMDFESVRSALKDHRPDGLKNLGGVGTITWKDLAAVLQVAAQSKARPHEQEYARTCSRVA